MDIYFLSDINMWEYFREIFYFMGQVLKTSTDLAAQAGPGAENEVYLVATRWEAGTKHAGSQPLQQQVVSGRLTSGQGDSTHFYPSEERVLFRRFGKCFISLVMVGL